MSDLPPPDPSTLAQGPTPTSRWARFQQRPRWQRWTTYVGAAFLALAGVGEDDSDTTDIATATATDSSATESTELITTTAEPSTSAAPPGR
jgi:hypothetical protein